MPFQRPMKAKHFRDDGIFKLLRSPGIDFKESIPPAYVAWAGIFKLLWSPGIDSASLCSLAGRYDNPIPTRFLAPKDCSKIPAQTAVMCPDDGFKCLLFRRRGEPCELWGLRLHLPLPRGGAQLSHPHRWVALQQRQGANKISLLCTVPYARKRKGNNKIK